MVTRENNKSTKNKEKKIKLFSKIADFWTPNY